MTPEIKVLTEMKWELDCSKTQMRKDYVPKDKFTDKTANGLTKCITTWLNLNGCQAERINSMGRVLDDRKIVTDVIGRQKMIGSTKYIPGTGTNGTADISATIKGRSVKIEVKMNDQQSEAQKKYQADIERAGGIYVIFRNFATFMVWYKSFVESNTEFSNTKNR